MSVCASFLSARLLFLLSFLQFFQSTFADRNVTVDDSDISIQYSADWSASSPSNSLDYGGFHHLSDNKLASASFTFTGSAVYIMCPLWPYAVGAQASVDGSSPVSIDMQDHTHTTTGGSETVASAVLWGMTGLSNSSHTLQISFWDTQQYIALDAIVYTVPEESISTTTSSAATAVSSGTSLSAQQSSSSKSKTSSTNHIVIIAGAAAGGVVLILAVIAGVICLTRRRRREGYKHQYRMAGTAEDAEVFGPGSGSRKLGGKSYTSALPDSPSMKTVPLAGADSFGDTAYQNPHTMSYYSDTSYTSTVGGVTPQHALYHDPYSHGGASNLGYGPSSSEGSSTEGSQYYGQPDFGASALASQSNRNVAGPSHSAITIANSTAPLASYPGQIVLSYSGGSSGSGEGSSSSRPSDVYTVKPYEEKRRLAEASRSGQAEQDAPPQYSG
ncbi:hypothetical protein GYMLUDRAFT_67275 [Collybiopsis luxurians FD-317 M1]|nr:hypothetical protein GYMLUDRAFT_67275 [Collybiopsis luxurians FD-317 M1]